MLNFENLDKRIFEGAGENQIPIIYPENDLKIDELEWIPFNYAKTVKDKGKKGVHFYIDDYQFNRLWNRPDVYIDMLREFGAVTTPDFSTYTSMPMAMQIYNHYRKHWLGAYWQEHEIHVIPTISWSAPESYKWCFDGEPIGGIVSVSSVGTQKSLYPKRLFANGYRAMLSRLQPKQILWYGKVPEEFDVDVIKIEKHPSYWRGNKE